MGIKSVGRGGGAVNLVWNVGYIPFYGYYEDEQPFPDQIQEAHVGKADAGYIPSILTHAELCVLHEPRVLRGCRGSLPWRP